MAKRSFDHGASAKLPVDQRGIVALEHIAHYLDRIEGHLKKLANADDLPRAPLSKVSPFPRQ
jgi:hypothetical protein